VAGYFRGSEPRSGLASAVSLLVTLRSLRGIGRPPPDSRVLR
jgi:hypothetical protein